ncbi:UvrD-helicase domain-containing protein [Plantactinospora sp. CA-290183]|uniref:UvrD-helicase domain-containing protein n=1 Tax=Plantactinospora sp. CA-290183 TaxID=3240006 RepID=UPI003D8E2437
MPSAAGNRAVIAAAGSRKTQLIIDAALADPTRRTLITTYTEENLAQIRRRLAEATGLVPAHITTMPWFTFLLREAARPFQASLTGRIDDIRSLNFHGSRSRFVRRENVLPYYFDRHGGMYRDGVTDFVCRADDASAGAVVRRLAAMYDNIYIDEFQDLVGYDVDFVDKLFASTMSVTVVGDPRQHTFATNNGPRNKKYRGAGILDWFHRPQMTCELEIRAESWRCHQVICNWSDRLFPNMPPTTSRNHCETGHDGVFKIAEEDVHAYVAKYDPKVLRDRVTTPTLGLPAMNIGLSKGSTYDRVLIFPTQPMRKYLKTADLAALRAPDRLYVAVTRAKHSVTFVVNRQEADYVP